MAPGGRLAANLGLILMVFTWGAFFPILERLLTRWDPYSATVSRQIVGSAVLFAFVLGTRRTFPLPISIPWKRLLLLGGVGVAIGSLLTSFGVMLSSGLSSAIISTTNPVGSALTAAAVYHEPLGRGIILGTILSVIGGLITVFGGQSLENTHFGGGEVLIVFGERRLDLDVDGGSALASRPFSIADRRFHGWGRCDLSVGAVTGPGDKQSRAIAHGVQR